MKEHRLFNITKNRWATPNEIAKYVLLDGAENRLIGEAWTTVRMTDKEIDDVCKFYYKHSDALRKKLMNNDEFETRAKKIR